MENAKKVSEGLEKRRNKTSMYNKLTIIGGQSLRLKGTHPDCAILHCPCGGNPEKFYGLREPCESDLKDRLVTFDSRVFPSEGDFSGLWVHNY